MIYKAEPPLKPPSFCYFPVLKAWWNYRFSTEKTPRQLPRGGGRGGTARPAALGPPFRGSSGENHLWKGFDKWNTTDIYVFFCGTGISTWLFEQFCSSPLTGKVKKNRPRTNADPNRFSKRNMGNKEETWVAARHRFKNPKATVLSWIPLLVTPEKDGEQVQKFRSFGIYTRF